MNAKAAFKGRNATYQTIIYRDMQSLANLIIDKSKRLDFDVPRLIIKRKDDLDIQQRILSMTPAERRIRGISKSGLWYQKKKQTEGRKIKVYDKTARKLGSK
jgi:hypothetical protein